VLAIPDGAEATKAVKGTTRQHGLPLRAIPGCVIAAYLRKIAAAPPDTSHGAGSKGGGPEDIRCA
jgi:hypothetical protein